jgi:hypothetical protein
MNQRKVSARYYLFEDLLWELPGFAGLKKVVPITDLQMYAGYVWAREAGKGECPSVKARRAKRDVSFYNAPWEGKPGSIHLIAKHQNLGGLLHELAHALGPHDKLAHGPAFRKRCIRLYREYGGWDGQVTW